MNRHARDWKRFQQRTGWIFGPGETAICVFALAFVVIFGADAILAYFQMIAIVGNWIVGGTP